MNHGIHFISGLPRAGSTLLAALLRQNPALHAGITSPVGSLAAALLRDMSQANETALFIDDAQRAAILRGVFSAYYHAVHPTRTVFDTNRGWTARADLLAALFPDCRIVCCVRHIPWIVDSMERLIQRNRFEPSKIFGFETDGTVYSRADGMLRDAALIGYPLAALKQAMHGAEAARLLLLPYDVLAARPHQALEAVYAFTGLPPFRHDVDRVTFDAKQFDDRLGTPGLHDVRPRTTLEPRETILPPDLWQRIEPASVWRDPAFNTRNVAIVA